MPKEYYAPMHTAEHILNQTMIRLIGCDRAFNCHIEKKKSKCDYHLDHALSQDEIKQVEDKVNEIIKQDLPISEYFLPYDEAAQRFNIRVPKEENPVIRIVQIGCLLYTSPSPRD